MKFIFVLLAAAGLMLSGPARAANIVFPADGAPAIGFTVPDNWTTSNDDPGKITATSADKSIVFTASFADFSGEMVDLANEISLQEKAGPAGAGFDLMISNFPGLVFYTRMDDNPDRQLRILIVQMDNYTAAVCTIAMSTADATRNRWNPDAFVQRIHLAPPTRER